MLSLLDDSPDHRDAAEQSDSHAAGDGDDGRDLITAEMNYQVLTAEGKYEFHNGILPSQLPRDGSAIYLRTGPELPEEDYMDQAAKNLSKGCCRRARKAMNLLNVSEVYSMPRVSEEARRQGGLQGAAYDIKNGYDLSTAAARRKVEGR